MAQPQIQRPPQGRPLIRLRQAWAGNRCLPYGLIAVAEAPRLAFSAVPTDCTAAMIATAMPAAIRPYSMAVAPDSLDKKSARNSRIINSRLRLHPDRSPLNFSVVVNANTLGGIP